MFQWYDYLAALFVPSVGTTVIMVKVEALTNFTNQALLDSTKAIQALNEEQIQMKKAVIQNRMALDILTAAQGGTCTIIKVECCVYIPDLSGNVSTALKDMQNQVKAMSNENKKKKNKHKDLTTIFIAVLSIKIRYSHINVQK